MLISRTKCVDPFFGDLTQKIVGAETVLLCAFSLFLQLFMLKVSHTFCGWNSDFFYVLLCMMCTVGAFCYAVHLVGHIRVIMVAPPSEIDRFIGAVFLSTLFTEHVISFLLVAHRLIYTIAPFKAARVLNPTVLKINVVLLVCFLISMLCFLWSPLAGVMFCSQSMTRHIMELPLKFMLQWMNTVSNYMVGAYTIIAYTILAGVLIVRGNIRLRNNAELRMMIQIAVMSTIGIFYFFFWQFHYSLGLNPVTGTIIYENLTLLYYDAVVLPYLLLNRSFRKRFVAMFYRNSTVCSTKSMVHKDVFFLAVARTKWLGKRTRIAS